LETSGREGRSDLPWSIRKRMCGPEGAGPDEVGMGRRETGARLGARPGRDWRQGPTTGVGGRD